MTCLDGKVFVGNFNDIIPTIGTDVYVTESKDGFSIDCASHRIVMSHAEVELKKQ